MSKEPRRIVRYSISFKQMVVREIEGGLGQESVRIKYGIGGMDTIGKWIRRFGKDHLLNKIVRIETMDEKDRVRELERQVVELKVALADASMAQRCLEIVIDEANKEYKTDLKKNFGASVSAKRLEKSR